MLTCLKQTAIDIGGYTQTSCNHKPTQTWKKYTKSKEKGTQTKHYRKSAYQKEREQEKKKWTEKNKNNQKTTKWQSISTLNADECTKL